METTVERKASTGHCCHRSKPTRHGKCGRPSPQSLERQTEENGVVSGMTALTSWSFSTTRSGPYVIQPAMHQCSPEYRYPRRSWALSKYIRPMTLEKSSWQHLQNRATSTLCPHTSWRSYSWTPSLYHGDVHWLTRMGSPTDQAAPRYCSTTYKESNSGPRRHEKLLSDLKLDMYV